MSPKPWLGVLVTCFFLGLAGALPTPSAGGDDKPSASGEANPRESASNKSAPGESTPRNSTRREHAAPNAVDQRPRLVAVIGESEYKTERTLPKFIERFLSRDFRVSVVHWAGEGNHRFPGIEILDDADVMLLSVRRCTPPKSQLDAVRRFVAAGKPLVAIRTSSHAFCLRNEKPAPGNEEWPDFDRQVLGCHYTGHAPTSGPHAARTTTVYVPSERRAHPILSGVDPGPRATDSWLYYSRPLGKRAEGLLFAKTPDSKAPDGNPPEPVAWTNVTKAGGRVFYTSLGSPHEFDDVNFQRMLRNAVYWAVGKEAPRD